MNVKVEDNVAIDANVESVSKAINGMLLHENVNIINLKYDVDVKSENLVKRLEDPTLQLFFRSILRLNINLVEKNQKETQFNYQIEYKSVKRKFWLFICCMTFISLCLFIPLLILLSSDVSSNEESSIQSIVFLCIVVIIVMNALLFWLFFFMNMSKKARDKQFHKLFLTRLEQFIKIVESKKTKNVKRTFDVEL